MVVAWDCELDSSGKISARIQLQSRILESATKQARLNSERDSSPQTFRKRVRTSFQFRGCRMRNSLASLESFMRMPSELGSMQRGFHPSVPLLNCTLTIILSD